MEWDVDFYKHFAWLKKVSMNFSVLVNWLFLSFMSIEMLNIAFEILKEQLNNLFISGCFVGLMG